MSGTVSGTVGGTGGGRAPPGRSSPPASSRHYRPTLPFPPLHRLSPTQLVDTTGASADVAAAAAVADTEDNTGTLTAAQIRMQAEAIAAAVEERDRRRAAAEKARNRRSAGRRKREDISKIPLRSRPTYIRQAFSDDDDSSSSRTTKSDSRTPNSRSASPLSGEENAPGAVYRRKHHKNQSKMLQDLGGGAGMMYNRDDFYEGGYERQKQPRDQPMDFGDHFGRYDRGLKHHHHQQPWMMKPQQHFDGMGPHHQRTQRQHRHAHNRTDAHFRSGDPFPAAVAAGGGDRARYDPMMGKFLCCFDPLLPLVWYNLRTSRRTHSTGGVSLSQLGIGGTGIVNSP